MGGVGCPEKFSCAGDGTTEKGEKQHWCMADEQAPPSVQCKLPEIMVYAADRNEALCGKPCKIDSECGSGKLLPYDAQELGNDDGNASGARKRHQRLPMSLRARLMAG